MTTLEQKKKEVLEIALKQRNDTFQNYKQGLPLGDTAFQFVLKNGRDELKEDITEDEIDSFLIHNIFTNESCSE